MLDLLTAKHIFEEWAEDTSAHGFETHSIGPHAYETDQEWLDVLDEAERDLEWFEMLARITGELVFEQSEVTHGDWWDDEGAQAQLTQDLLDEAESGFLSRTLQLSVYWGEEVPIDYFQGEWAKVVGVMADGAVVAVMLDRETEQPTTQCFVLTGVVWSE